MTQENSYSIKLKDPRWQKKRLKIFERDNWTCQICGSIENSLVAHHLWYFSNKEPWDYNDHYIVTLCEVCHQKETDQMDAANTMIMFALKQLFYSDGIKELSNLLLANIKYFYYKPKLNGKHKGQILINEEWNTKDQALIKFLNTSNDEIEDLRNSIIPILVKNIYIPQTEVCDGKTD
jgi:hypothetical protein